MKRAVKNFWIPIIAIAGFVALMTMSFVGLLRESKTDVGTIIAHDVIALRDVFHKIHRDCTIIDFDDQKSSINFLNVRSFSGSEVGPLNMVHPKKWQGPYMQGNPTMQKIAYQVVTTTKGYFITPGDGVKLPNGKVVGKDIILDKKSDIAALARDKNALLFKDSPLAVPLTLGTPINIQFFSDNEM